MSVPDDIIVGQDATDNYSPFFCTTDTSKPPFRTTLKENDVSISRFLFNNIRSSPIAYLAHFSWNWLHWPRLAGGCKWLQIQIK